MVSFGQLIRATKCVFLDIGLNVRLYIYTKAVKRIFDTDDSLP